MSKFATYTGHYRDNAEGHIHLDKEGACTIRLQGAASMPQNELDRYGKIMAEAINLFGPVKLSKEFEDE